MRHYRVSFLVGVVWLLAPQRVERKWIYMSTLLQEFVSGKLAGVPGAPLNGSLVIGQEQDRFGGHFDKYQVRGMCNCFAGGYREGGKEGAG